MSSAVLIALAAADHGRPACLLSVCGSTLAGRLVAQLREQGAETVTVLTRPEWRAEVAAAVDGCTVEQVDGLAGALGAIADRASRPGGALLLGHADLVTHTSALAGLLADPRVPSGILCSVRTPAGASCPRVRLVRGRVMEAESAYHAVPRPSHAFLGLCKVDGGDRAALAEVAGELQRLTAGPLPPEWESEYAHKVARWGAAFFRQHGGADALADHLDRLADRPAWLPGSDRLRADLDARFAVEVLRPAAAWRDDPVALCVTGLARRDTALTGSYLRNLVWARPLSQHDADEAAAALAAVDEDRLVLDSAVKAADGFFTTFFVSPYSKHLARWCARRGLTPNQVTAFSMLLGIVAALAFATGSRPGLVAGAVLLQLAFTTDCVDGQLARYTRQFSKLGAWLDSILDRSKEYVVYAGLAWGAATVQGDRGVWLLAAAALTLQTLRHTIDFGFSAQEHQRMGSSGHAPLASARDQPAARTGPLDLVASPDAPAGAPRGAGARGTLAGQGVRLSARLEQRGWLRWGKRIIVLPIGERFALISLTAAIADARVTFTALLVWGAVAAAYTVAGRVLRSVA